MLWLMNEITDMPGWQGLVGDDAVVAKWVAHIAKLVRPEEAQRRTDDSPNASPALRPELAAMGCTPAMLNACIAELRAKASICAR